MRMSLAIELKTTTWHIRVHRAPDGSSFIERLHGPVRTTPASWSSDRTPEDLVRIQRSAVQFTATDRLSDGTAPQQ